MALNLGYYIEKDSSGSNTPRLRKFRNTPRGDFADLDMGDEDPMVIGADPVTDTASFKNLTPNDGGATGNGELGLPTDTSTVLDKSVNRLDQQGGSSGAMSAMSPEGAAIKAGQAGIKAGLGIIQGYMKADAIRSKANYEADILQLNADMQLFEAGEQQGVDFTKIIRYGAQVDEVVDNTRSEFTRLDQEGGAAQDLIAENTLQGRLNQMAMKNEAMAKVSSAEFAQKLSYLKAKQAREISKKQGQQAIQAGYLDAALMFAGM